MIPKRQLARNGIDKGRFLAALDAAAAIDYRDSLASVTARTLVVVGEQDRANRPAAELLGSGITGAQLAVVPGVSGPVHTGDPAQFNALVFDFLSAAPTS